MCAFVRARARHGLRGCEGSWVSVRDFEVVGEYGAGSASCSGGGRDVPVLFLPRTWGKVREFVGGGCAWGGQV